MVMPGDTFNMKLTLIAPIAMDVGIRFSIHESGCTVSADVVTKIIA